MDKSQEKPELESEEEVITVTEEPQLSGYKTFTGIPAEDIPARLMKPFDEPKAYKGTGGRLDLTDINTGYMLERITEVFGPKGFGWNLCYEAENMEIIGETVATRINSERPVIAARLKYATLEYNLIGPDRTIVVSIPTSGFSINDPAYAEEGARTNAIGSALKGMCFQLDIYKGLLDHNTANKEEYERRKAEEEEEKKKAAAARKKKAEEAKKKKEAEEAKKKAETAAVALERAKAYKVPADLPQEGKTLGELLKIEPIGLAIIGYLAGKHESLQGKLFEPKAGDEDEEKLQLAAEHIWTVEKLADRLLDLAKAYTVPVKLPMEGKTLGELLKIEPMGLAIIGYLAAMHESPQGKLFKPSDEEGKKLQLAAKHLWVVEKLEDRLNGKELKKEKE